MSEFTNGWKPYEGGRILFDSKEVLQQKKLCIRVISGREIVFAGDDDAKQFLEENGFSPVQDLKFKEERDQR